MREPWNNLWCVFGKRPRGHVLFHKDAAWEPWINTVRLTRDESIGAFVEAWGEWEGLRRDGLVECRRVRLVDR
jgi:hypothetical protein